MSSIVIFDKIVLVFENRNMQISYTDLQKVREKHRDKKIVFASGSFDLPHGGHALFLEDAKKLGGILVVGVGGDEIVRLNKGPGHPIMNQALRIKLIDSLKPVDYTLLDDNQHNNKSPLGFVEYVLQYLKPDIYAVNNDAFSPEKRREMTKNYGVVLHVMERWCPPEFEKVSTTSLIEKMKQAAED